MYAQCYENGTDVHAVGVVRKYAQCYNKGAEVCTVKVVGVKGKRMESGTDARNVQIHVQWKWYMYTQWT